jgi:hypothetical protein
MNKKRHLVELFGDGKNGARSAELPNPKPRPRNPAVVQPPKKATKS